MSHDPATAAVASGVQSGELENPKAEVWQVQPTANRPCPPPWGRVAALVVLALALTVLAAPPLAATVPPVPSTPTAACGATVSGKCYVGGTFSLSTSSAGAHHYALCRSNDTTGWGGCNVLVTANSGSTITVSGSHLPSNGLRRAYYASACDSANQCTSWGASPPVYVHMDTSGPSAPGNTAVGCTFTQGDNCWVTGSFTASVSPSSDIGSGVGGYHICRSHDSSGGWAGCSVSLTTNGSTSQGVSGSHLASDGRRRAYYFQAKDRVGNWGAWNGPRYVRVDRYPPTVSATNASNQWFDTRTATVAAADAVSGASANSGLAALRYRWNAALNGGCTNGSTITSGVTLTVPEGDNTLYLCARDQTGRISQWNGQYRVDSAPPSAPGNPSISCRYTSGDNCWVTGSFTINVTPATDNGSGVSGYHICRSLDSLGGWAGCSVSLTLSGGTSYTPSGAQLPVDGMRRSYQFQAQDQTGNWGDWSGQRYVRVDRHDPTVSATNTSSQWFDTRTATIAAADSAGGASANVGLAEVRYRFNTALNGACTDGTMVASGATLTVPEGDNTLYLCARDHTDRVGTWSGTYRVDTTIPSWDAVTVSSSFWSIGDSSSYEITARASDTGSGVRELRTVINLQGSNSTERRGNFSWRDASLGYLWSADQVPCAGGGFASKHPTNQNPETVTLVGCSTTLTGDQREVVFTVRPEASFGTFGPINDISLWARDFRLNATGWKGFDLNFASGLLPPAKLKVRENSTTLGDQATVDWGTVDIGGGLSWKFFKVKNVAPAGSGNLVLEHTPSNVVVTGSNAFSIGDGLSSPLAVGQQDTFVVRFDTNQLGTHAGVLEIWHNDPARPNPLVVNLAGEVTAEPVVTSVDGGPVLKEQTRVLTVHGSNLQNATVMIATQEAVVGTPARVYPTATLLSVNGVGTRMDVRVDASATGIDGYYYIAIETSGGATVAQFRVVGPEPVVDYWTPSQPIAGLIHVVQVLGENLAGANLVPMRAGVMILDVDNADSKSLSGLMFVSSGIPLGEIDLRIDGTGGSTMLPMEIQPTIPAASLRTHLLDTKAGPDVGLAPQIVLQDLISAHAPEDLAAMHGAQVGDDPDGRATRGGCFTISGGRSFSFSKVLVSLMDNNLGNPLAQQAINALLPEQNLDFTSLTLALTAYIQFEFNLSLCGYDTLDVSFCVRAGISVMVPFVGGWTVQYDSCLGINIPGSPLPPDGRVSGHTYSTSNPCVQAIDTSPPGFLEGQRSGQLKVTCCQNATISVQTNGEALGGTFEGEQPIVETQLVCSEDEPLELRIKEVTFDGDLEVKRDQVGSVDVIMDPVWSDPELDGTPAVENNAVAYIRGSSVRVIAKLAVNPLSQTPQTVRIRATSLLAGITLESALTTIGGGEAEAIVIMDGVGTLPNMTQAYEPLVLDWTYTVASGPEQDAGQTSHPFYVTLAEPLANSLVTMTALDLGVGAGGVSNDSAALEEIWRQFEGPANVKGWDGRLLSYYPEGEGVGTCAQSSLPLLTSPKGAGACKSFAILMRDALALNGIPSTIIEVRPTDGTSMLIKNWTFHTPTFPKTEHPWELCVANSEGPISMVPPLPNGRYCDLTSEVGVPGQNTQTPSEKIFGVHYIVYMPFLGGLTAYFDPSYGTRFQSEANFETIAVGGILKEFPQPVGASVLRVRKKRLFFREVVFTEDN